ncbi:MAG: glycosyltransferase [Calditrichaeota bacterium]|nr:MAG: glycosyltransferase [Calditrichota bacterium]
MNRNADPLMTFPLPEAAEGMPAEKKVLRPVRPIRVVHLVNDLVPGGKEHGLVKLLRHMDRERFERILVVFNRVEFTGSLEEEGCQIVRLNKAPGNDWRLPFRLARLFRSLGADVVHTHAWGTLVEGVLAARLAGVPVIIHGEHGTFPRGALHRRVQKFFWARAHRVLSVSALLADTLAEEVGFPREKIEVVRNGVDPQRFYASSALRRQGRAELNLSGDGFLIGTVGRLHPVKNLPMLVRATHLLVQRGFNPRVLIVGDDDGDGARVHRLVQALNLTEVIQLLPFTQDVNRIYNALDLFVLTSLSEGCSNVLQEAQFVGVPVVATRVGGNPELVVDGQTGLLVESDRPEQLAEAIARLMTNPDQLQRLKRAAYHHAQTHFSLNSMVEGYQQIYLHELSRRKPELFTTKEFQP